MAEFGLHAGKHEINTQNKDCIIICIFKL